MYTLDIIFFASAFSGLVTPISNGDVLDTFIKMGKSASVIFIKKEMVTQGLQIPTDKAIEISVDKYYQTLKTFNKNVNTNPQAVQSHREKEYIFQSKRKRPHS